MDVAEIDTPDVARVLSPTWTGKVEAANRIPAACNDIVVATACGTFSWIAAPRPKPETKPA